MWSIEIRIKNQNDTEWKPYINPTPDKGLIDVITKSLSNSPDTVEYRIIEWHVVDSMTKAAKLMIEDAKMEFQVRSEETGTQFFKSLKEAVQAAEDNPSIWKISFSLPNGERVRLISSDTGTWLLQDLFDGK